MSYEQTSNADAGRCNKPTRIPDHRRRLRSEPGITDPFPFRTTEEAFNWRIFPAVTLTSHDGNHTIALRQFLVVMTGILASSVWMLNQPRRWCPQVARHQQGAGHQRYRFALEVLAIAASRFSLVIVHLVMAFYNLNSVSSFCGSLGQLPCGSRPLRIQLAATLAEFGRYCLVD